MKIIEIRIKDVPPCELDERDLERWKAQVLEHPEPTPVDWRRSLWPKNAPAITPKEPSQAPDEGHDSPI